MAIHLLERRRKEEVKINHSLISLGCPFGFDKLPGAGSAKTEE